MKFTSYVVLFCIKLEITFVLHQGMNMINVLLIGGCWADGNNHRATK
jgi:hypothetical protein